MQQGSPFCQSHSLPSGSYSSAHLASHSTAIFPMLGLLALCLLLQKAMWSTVILPLVWPLEGLMGHTSLQNNPVYWLKDHVAYEAQSFNYLGICFFPDRSSTERSIPPGSESKPICLICPCFSHFNGFLLSCSVEQDEEARVLATQRMGLLFMLF